MPRGGALAGSASTSRPLGEERNGLLREAAVLPGRLADEFAVEMLGKVARIWSSGMPPLFRKMHTAAKCSRRPDPAGSSGHGSSGHSSSGDGSLGNHGVDALQRPPQRAELVEAQRVGPVGKRSARELHALRTKTSIGARGDRGLRQSSDELRLAARGRSRRLPGSCTLCVASKTTGQPKSRIMASDRMSTTRL